MKKKLLVLKEFILDILFPKFCLNCGKEGTYLCQDCFSLIDVLKRQYCPFCLSEGKRKRAVIDGKTCPSCRRKKKLNGLYCAAPYENFIVKKLINRLKYKPRIKELSQPLCFLILVHLFYLESDKNRSFFEGDFNVLSYNQNQQKIFPFGETIIIPVPLHKRKLKERGFNQAAEIGKELSLFFKIPIYNNVLIRIKNTISQTKLKKEEREKNVKGAFICRDSKLIKRKKVLLLDDVFTSGATMEECAAALKRGGAKEVWGMAAAGG